ncbi:ribonuclease P protein component [Belliella sp. DSM 111904]|uniref:Ribonuclease P protein component n=1 Tax=Belliella filtrata TaxID=2923435 RepID=A0ABS9UY19_9BACT|nr:ribonuclease P protein component [Belliella filtrata]MCH7409071.1 ribonuclease P protein component [Belliella filtrata]
MKKYGLPKNERLHSQKAIKELFDKGSSFFLYPLKVLYIQRNISESETIQVLFSVSKRKIKKAVNRNLIKRRLKETYRLNKGLLEAQADSKMHIALIYVSSEIIEFDKIESTVIKVLTKLNELQQES